MNNYKKIGLTALAASLVSVSAHAGALTASGSAKILSEGHTGNGLNAGTTFSMGNSVTFKGSGELDNGMTVSLSFELDQGTSNNSSNGFDNHSVTVSSDSLGTLTFAGHGGSSSTGKIDTTAAGDMWDNFDGLSSDLGVTFTKDGIRTSSGVDNSFFYASPDLMDGLNFTLSYNPQAGNSGNPSETGYGINYTGVEGLSLSYANADEESGTTATSGDVTVYKASYAYGPVTASYSNSEMDIAAAANAAGGESTSYALSYTVSDEISVTYGSETHSIDSTSVDMEIEGFSASYTSGGMTISAAMQSMDDGDFATGANNDIDYWALGASFAF
jgi:outer membrane protein OmpU